MKEKKKKRKILAALIPVLIFLLAVALLAQGVLKSEPEAVPNPVQGISADSSLKRVSGNWFCLCRIQDRRKRRGSARAAGTGPASSRRDTDSYGYAGTDKGTGPPDGDTNA